MTTFQRTPTLVILGASGSGRSTIGTLIARETGLALSETEREFEIIHQRRYSDALDELVTQDDFDRFNQQVELVALKQLQNGGSEEKSIVTLLPSALAAASVKQALKSLVEVGIPVIYLQVPIAQLARRLGLNAPRSLALGQPRSLFAQMVKAAENNFHEVGATEWNNVGLAPEELTTLIIEKNALK